MPLPGTAPTARALAERYPAHVGAARLYGEAFRADTPLFYRELRARHGGVAPVLLEGDLPAWLVLGYREVHHLLGHSDLYDRAGRGWNALDLVPPDWPLRRWLVDGGDSLVWLNGAVHERRAEVVADALAEHDPFAFRTACEQIANALVDTFARDGAADLVSQYALPLPAAALGRLLGLPSEEIAALVRDRVTVPGRGAEAPAALRRQHDQMRARPGHDATSRMVTHPDELGTPGLASDLLSVVAAGQTATAHWIGNTLRLLVTAGQFAPRADGARPGTGHALTAVLWNDSPVSNLAARFIVRPVTLGAYGLEPGDLVLLSVGAANTDPAVRTGDARATEASQAHLAFGHGPHGCPVPARELGTIIAEAAVEVLLDRLPDVALAVSPEDLRWQGSLVVRGLEALPVVFTAA